VFGLSAGEFVILLVVGIVVLGPQKLPGMMRTAGRWVRKLRRMSTELRAQSGIDRMLREEGLDRELRELRELKSSLSRQAVLDSLVEATNRPLPDRPTTKSAPSAASSTSAPMDAASSSAAAQAASSTAVDATKSRSDGANREGPEALEHAPSPKLDAPVDALDVAPAPSSVAARIRPAPGAVPRGAGPAKEPSPSIREREYPLWGPDHYEAMPDDLDPEEEALSAGQAQGHGLPDWKPEEPAPAAPVDPAMLEEALA
jgi:sec-independent protein translocase protein TatB